MKTTPFIQFISLVRGGGGEFLCSTRHFEGNHQITLPKTTKRRNIDNKTMLLLYHNSAGKGGTDVMVSKILISFIHEYLEREGTFDIKFL